MPRPQIPAEISREVLIESGHRCAVCGVPCPLERAHIVPWRQCKEHTADNLICLCANCHQRADLEKWGVKVLQKYKVRPWVLRQNNHLLQVTPRTSVSITIEKEFERFDEHEENMLRHALASFLRISPSTIKVTSREKGSVKLILELPTSAADDLVDSFQKEDPTLQSPRYWKRRLCYRRSLNVRTEMLGHSIRRHSLRSPQSTKTDFKRFSPATIVPLISFFRSEG